MALWMVRAGRRGDRESLALEEGVAVIGWQEMGDLSDADSREEMQRRIEAAFPDATSRQRATSTGQVWAFAKRIEPGDLVALPLKSRPAVAFGEVTGPYRYRTDLADGVHHTRPVRWLKEVPRNRIESDLLYSFGSMMTVCRIKRNDAEARIRAMLRGERAPRAVETDESGSDTDEEHAAPDLERYARDQIRDFVGRRFKGHALAGLVAATLEAEGYQVVVPPAGPDGGVDIIAGRGPLGFDPPRLCVQVKSQDAPVDVKVLRELQGVMKNFGAENGLLVAWGGFKQSVEREARRLFFEIRLWDGDDLVRMLQASYERLPESVQAELPLQRVWTLVPEE